LITFDRGNVPLSTTRQEGSIMKQEFTSKRAGFLLAALCPVLALLLSAGTARAATVSYILDGVILADGSPMTGAFDWTYQPGDFEGGSGTFTALEIPYRPTGTAPPMGQDGMIFTIETKQIEISLDGNFHDYGLDIILKLTQPLSLTLASSVDVTTSFFECCGNGFHDQPFSSGEIAPAVATVPLPAALPLFGATTLLFGLFGCRSRLPMGPGLVTRHKMRDSKI